MFGKLPQLVVGGFVARVFADGKKAGEDANDVAVQNRRGLVEGDAANRAGGVAANSGQRENFVVGFRKSPVVHGHYFPGGFVHIAHAGVIAQSFPKLMDLFGSCPGQGLDGWQSLHPALPIGDDGFDLGLLEHDFGNPDGVSVAGATPREIAGILGKPIKERWDEEFNFGAHSCGV